MIVISHININIFLTAKPKHRLGRALFLLKNIKNKFLALVLPNLN